MYAVEIHQGLLPSQSMIRRKFTSLLRNRPDIQAIAKLVTLADIESRGSEWLENARAGEFGSLGAGTPGPQ